MEPYFEFAKASSLKVVDNQTNSSTQNVGACEVVAHFVDGHTVGKWKSTNERDIERCRLVHGITWIPGSTMIVYQTDKLVLRIQFKADSNMLLVDSIMCVNSDKYSCRVNYGKSYSVRVCDGRKGGYGGKTIDSDVVFCIDSKGTFRPGNVISVDLEELQRYPVFETMRRLPFTNGPAAISQFNKAIASLELRWYFDLAKNIM